MVYKTQFYYREALPVEKVGIYPEPPILLFSKKTTLILALVLASVVI